MQVSVKYTNKIITVNNYYHTHLSQFVSYIFSSSSPLYLPSILILRNEFHTKRIV